ncbi:MAG TPA: pore-forming protein [Lactobacillus sp.]|nr:pore-forming protein [Lactobacillus sp.]
MEQKFYCQPDIPSSITCWSYTFMIFLLSLFLWLEITVFQIWTAIAFVCFVLVTAIQLWRRQLVITDREVKFKRVLSLNDKIIARSDIKEVVATKYQLKITDRYRTYSVLMLPKSKEKCLKALK